MENFSHIVLTVDEIIDDGIIMETEARTVAQRVEKVESSAQTITIAGEKVNLGEEGNAIASKLFKTAQGVCCSVLFCIVTAVCCSVDTHTLL